MTFKSLGKYSLVPNSLHSNLWHSLMVYRTLLEPKMSNANDFAMHRANVLKHGSIRNKPPQARLVGNLKAQDTRKSYKSGYQTCQMAVCWQMKFLYISLLHTKLRPNRCNERTFDQVSVEEVTSRLFVDDIIRDMHDRICKKNPP